jgi:putative zinc finger protein
MTCERFRSLLDDHVDGTLPPAESTEMKRHLLACAACRSGEQSLRSLKDSARSLPESIEPARNLWAGIESGLRSRPADRIPRAAKRSFLRPALLAAGLAAVLAGAGYMRMLQSRAPETRSVTAGGGTEAPGAVSASNTLQPPATIPGVGGAELTFLEAREQLRTALYERRKSLSPETLKAVDANLKIIENAIVEIRTAVEKDPGNRELQRMLIATRQREVALMRHVTQTADLRSR